MRKWPCVNSTWAHRWASLASGCEQTERPFTLHPQKKLTRYMSDMLRYKNSYWVCIVYSRKTTSKTFLRYICVQYNRHHHHHIHAHSVNITLGLILDHSLIITMSSFSLDEHLVYGFILQWKLFTAATLTLCVSTANKHTNIHLLNSALPLRKVRSYLVQFLA